MPPKNDGPTNRELFNKLMEVMDKQTLIKQQTAEAMTKLSDNVSENTRSVKSKMWNVIYISLSIAAFAIGLKLSPW